MIVIPEGTSAPQQLFVYEHDAGRLELQWFHILILGRRNEELSNIAKGYLEYMIHVLPYTYFMTDKRPDVMPVSVKIFEEC